MITILWNAINAFIHYFPLKKNDFSFKRSDFSLKENDFSLKKMSDFLKRKIYLFFFKEN